MVKQGSNLIEPFWVLIEPKSIPMIIANVFFEAAVYGAVTILGWCGHDGANSEFAVQRRSAGWALSDVFWLKAMDLVGRAGIYNR